MQEHTASFPEHQVSAKPQKWRAMVIQRLWIKTGSVLYFVCMGCIFLKIRDLDRVVHGTQQHNRSVVHFFHVMPRTSGACFPLPLCLQCPCSSLFLKVSEGNSGALSNFEGLNESSGMQEDVRLLGIVCDGRTPNQFPTT